MCCTYEGYTYGERAIVVRLDKEHPTFPDILNDLDNVPQYRKDVQELVIEQNFGASEANHFSTMTAEASSIVFIRGLLTHLSPALRSLTLVRLSCDPLHSSLEGKRLLNGISFPSLKSLSISGSPSTTAHFSFPLTGGFAPELQHLQLPSDMLCGRLSYNVSDIFPSLTSLTIHPLRPFYTHAQLLDLLKIGEQFGVFTSERDSVSYVDERRVPRSRATGQGRVVVIAYLEPNATRRLEEVQRFARAVKERLIPGMEERFRIQEVEGAEPSLQAMTRAAEPECMNSTLLR